MKTRLPAVAFLTLAVLFLSGCQKPWSTAYFGANSPRRVGYVPVTGGTPTTLLAQVVPECLQWDEAHGELLVDGYGTITRYSPDGKYLGEVARDANPLKMAIDPKKGQLYWIGWKPGANGIGRVERCDLPSGAHRVTLADHLPVPGALGLDVRHGYVYFAHGQEPPARGLYRAHLDGSGAEHVGQTDYIEALAVDSDGGRLYWPDKRTHQMWSSRLDGSDIQIIIPQIPWEVEDLALDPAAHKLYWIERRSGSTDKQSRIRRSDLDGRNIETVSALADGQDQFTALALGRPPPQKRSAPSGHPSDRR